MASMEQEVAQQSTTRLITDNLDIWTAAIAHKSGTGRGASKKYSLHGIQRLRELILELAVRGRLVPQDETDEPASVLLERIAEEKAQLVKAGKIKKAKALPAISEDEKPFVLPNGWEWCRLNSIATASTGYAFKSSEYTDNGTFVLRVTNINPNGTINKTDNKYIDPTIAINEYSKFFLSENDVLMVMVGGSLGKIGIVSKEILPAVLNQNMWKLAQLGNIPVSFFKDVLESINRNQITITASTHGHLAQGEYLSKLVALPPIQEQHRIVAKVDELMRLCDALEAQTIESISAHQTLVETLLDALLIDNQRGDSFAENWQRVLDHFDTLFTTTASIDTLKQTILQLAVMGKLVPQDANDEPASKLLERIAEEKAQLIKDKKIKKQKPLPEITEDEKPFAVSSGWKWCRIFDISLFTEYGTSEKTIEGSDGVPVLKMGDIQEGKVIHGGQKVVPRTIEDLPNLYLNYGDVLYNRTNSAELVGKTGMFEGEDNTYTFASYLIRIRCHFESLIPQYLTLVMNTPLFRRTQIEPHVKQQCGQANVNGTIMKSMLVPVCPIQEQHRIVAKVDELLSLCDQLKARLQQAQEKQVLLTDAIVTQAL